ncbi:hypothetical protein CA13_42180 [Planctomycetes bacterium CA13]|uniref:Glycosyltransferase subfamily 4-like N-terminal domain-containing protein n=1 Tax=Novipirellula herctigrandis TaxID=2527986 RepID=A0A5C5Z6B2_9BACT|nr:hypothetical protein CA13_42180 [Planctomycetes bacterium CA13]
MTNHEARVLFICYAYPPTGGAGVQRSVKFTKYLPHFGWQPTVLTAANPSVPVSDNDLLNDIDPETIVLRAKTLEPSYSVKQNLATSKRTRRFSPKRWIRHAAMSVLQPDPQVLWNPLAWHMANKILKQHHKAIYVSGPPFSSFLLGRSLKRRFQLPLVLDFRDEWLLASQYMDNHQRTGSSQRRQLAMLHKVLKSADAVLATTQASADELNRQIKNAGGTAPVTCLYNGYDEDDIAGVNRSEPTTDRLRIVYTGTLWKLTDVSPIVSALLRLSKSDPNTAARIELAIVGRRTPEQNAILKKLKSSAVKLILHDYVPHGQSLDLAASADTLLLLLADEAGAERVVPAKLFEYLALKKPILAVCGDGEMATLLRQQQHFDQFHPKQTKEIATWIGSRWRDRESARRDQVQHQPHVKPIQRYSRRELTGQLAGVIDSIVPNTP